MRLRDSCPVIDTRVQAMVAHVLDGDDGLVVLIDRQRALSFAGGFSLSPCQLELLVHQIEQAFRTVAGMPLRSIGPRPRGAQHVDGDEDDYSAYRAADARHGGHIARVEAGGHAVESRSAVGRCPAVSSGPSCGSTTRRRSTP